MNNEIFKKDGTLRARPPKRYLCANCGYTSSKTFSVRMVGIVFATCNNCGGTIKERDVYIEWNKRKSGQYDIELKILEILKDGVKRNKDEIEEIVGVKDRYIFNKAFSDLCYDGLLEIHTNKNNEHTYGLKRGKLHNE